MLSLHPTIMLGGVHATGRVNIKDCMQTTTDPVILIPCLDYVLGHEAEDAKNDRMKRVRHRLESHQCDHTNGAPVCFHAFTRWQNSCEREMVKRCKVGVEAMEDGTMAGLFALFDGREDF